MSDQRDSPGQTADSKQSTLCFCQPISEDVERAQQWLLTGSGEVPSLLNLACTVNAYDRYQEVDALCAWAETRLALLNSGQIALLSTQDLLDLLFYFNRAERFIDGTFEAHSGEIDSIIVEISRRVSLADQPTPPPSPDRDQIGKERKRVYTLLELLGKRPSGGWLRGDFILIERFGNRGVFRSSIEAGFSVNGNRARIEGSTIVNVTLHREIKEMVSDGIVTFPESDPLRLLSVGKDAQGNMVVEAEF